MRVRAVRVVFSILSCALLCGAGTEGQGEELIPGMGQLDSFDSMRGEYQGSLRGDYLFTLSPDEQWLLAFRPGRALLHLPSNRLWDQPDERGSLGFPNCFSADSKTLHAIPYDGIKAWDASLSPGMSELTLHEVSPRNLNRLDAGAFLDSESIARDPAGQPLLTWSERFPLNSNGSKWIRGSTRLYEVASSDKSQTSFLIVSPPEQRKGISNAPIVAYWQEYFARVNRTNRPKIRAHDEATGTRLDAFVEEQQRWVLETPMGRVDLLSISPDGKFLAAVGADTPRLGVLIPLDRGGLAAYPFAKNVYGRMIWSRDSKRLYFYAQPIAGAGSGTVHRLTLDPLAFPQSLPETALSAEQRAAPSPTELDRRRAAEMQRETPAE